MELEYVVNLVTVLVTLVFGIISKKNPKISNKIIPLQNLVIGILVSLIDWIITKDFKVSITLSGIFAGGTYDIVHNLNKLIKGE